MQCNTERKRQYTECVKDILALVYGLKQKPKDRKKSTKQLQRPIKSIMDPTRNHRNMEEIWSPLVLDLILDM